MRQSAETKSELKTTLAEVEPLSRRSLLVGLVAGAALSIPILSKPAEAAVSMLRTGVDPSVVEPDDLEIGRGGRGGGRGRGGRGRGGRGRGRGRSFGGRGRGRSFGGRGRGRSFARGRGHGRGRRWYGGRGRRWYGGGWYGGGWGGGCYNPWYRRTYWWRCRGIWLGF